MSAAAAAAAAPQLLSALITVGGLSRPDHPHPPGQLDDWLIDRAARCTGGQEQGDCSPAGSTMAWGTGGGGGGGSSDYLEAKLELLRKNEPSFTDLAILSFRTFGRWWRRADAAPNTASRHTVAVHGSAATPCTYNHATPTTGASEAERLATALEGNTSLTCLQASGHDIGVEGAEAMAKALTANASLRTVRRLRPACRHWLRVSHAPSPPSSWPLAMLRWATPGSWRWRQA